jgi:hypothetical protein
LYSLVSTVDVSAIAGGAAVGGGSQDADEKSFVGSLDLYLRQKNTKEFCGDRGI